MGMYTEILVKARVDVKSLTPIEFKVLDYLFGDGDEPTDLSQHEFFKCPRWMCVGHSDSYYHVPVTTNVFQEGYIFSRSDFKNYDSEITKFFDWFRDICSNIEGECIGYDWYEENDKPTLIFK